MHEVVLEVVPDHQIRNAPPGVKECVKSNTTAPLLIDTGPLSQSLPQRRVEKRSILGWFLTSNRRERTDSHSPGSTSGNILSRGTAWEVSRTKIARWNPKWWRASIAVRT